MSSRRMFSSKVVETARFLRLSAEAQAAYLFLGLACDDDGVVEALPTLRMAGKSPGALPELVEAGFVTVLSETDLIIFINDNLENNQLRADRKTDSIYQDLLRKKFPKIKLIKPRKRADIKGTTAGRPADNQVQSTYAGHGRRKSIESNVMIDQTELTLTDDQLDELAGRFGDDSLRKQLPKAEAFVRRKGLTVDNPYGFMNDWLTKTKGTTPSPKLAPTPFPAVDEVQTLGVDFEALEKEVRGDS